MALRMCFEGGWREARVLIRWVRERTVYEQRWGMGKVTRYSQDGRAFDGPRERYLLCGTRLEVYITLFLLF